MIFAYAGLYEERLKVPIAMGTLYVHSVVLFQYTRSGPRLLQKASFRFRYCKRCILTEREDNTPHMLW